MSLSLPVCLEKKQFPSSNCVTSRRGLTTLHCGRWNATSCGSCSYRRLRKHPKFHEIRPTWKIKVPNNNEVDHRDRQWLYASFTVIPRGRLAIYIRSTLFSRGFPQQHLTASCNCFKRKRRQYSHTEIVCTRTCFVCRVSPDIILIYNISCGFTLH